MRSRSIRYRWLTPDGPANLVREPAQFDLHIFDSGAGFVTHMAFIEDFERPYPFVG